MVQLSILEQSPLSGKPEVDELEHFMLWFISNEAHFLLHGLLLEQKAGLLQVHQETSLDLW